MSKKYDFSGWATRVNLRCSDGRRIMKDAFKDCDGKTVPLVWNHGHDDPENVIGHALLKNMPEGVYAYGTFNDTPKGRHSKEMVLHEDVTGLSIYANRLEQNGNDVLHGQIRELSLVLAGANPGAYIDNVIRHGEETDDEVIIYSDEQRFDISDSFEDDDVIEHADEDKDDDDDDDDDETVGDVINSMTDKQRNVMYALIGQALEESGSNKESKEDEEVKHNVFDSDECRQGTALSHSDMMGIFNRAKQLGSLRDAVLEFTDNYALQHDDETGATYGIDKIDWLFPEARNLNNPPEFLGRDQNWVSVVMNGVHKTPFSRIKSSYANITEDEARAKGYIKGHMKKEEVFSLLKRSTTPQTIYKKQKLDRDDIIDITDFDVVAWIKREMRMMLDEEIARAILVGDGRLNSDDDKISPDHIRPISDEADLFAVKVKVPAAMDPASLIKEIVRAHKYYKGSGNPIFFTTDDILTEMLLVEDGINHPMYADEAALARKLRVSRIVTVPVMESMDDMIGIIVNLNDYNVGADKGGEVNMFDDFDIDYNQQKYLMETRFSGALIKPFSALVIRKGEGNTTTVSNVVISNFDPETLDTKN